MQQIENPLEIKFLKKEIAQLKTLLNEFKLGLRGDNTSNDQRKKANYYWRSCK